MDHEIANKESFNDQMGNACEEIDRLNKKLSIAVEALNLLHGLRGLPPSKWNIVEETLRKIREVE